VLILKIVFFLRIFIYFDRKGNFNIINFLLIGFDNILNK